MASVQQQVTSASDVIGLNISQLADNRGFLSQNVLSQLRNLLEALAVWMHTGDASTPMHYGKVGPAFDAFAGKVKYRLLSRFHGLLQASASHYTLDGDPSERLMLKYFEFLMRTRDLALRELGVEILDNLEKFPVDQDQSLREYRESIARCVDHANESLAEPARTDRYYIHSSRPFFVCGRIYYEVTFSVAHDRASKFDRTIAFTDIDLTDKYAATLSLGSDQISVLGRTMPIVLIRSWEVSIRPCEFTNFAYLFGASKKTQSGHAEYRNLMMYLTRTQSNLLDLMDMPDVGYAQIRDWCLSRSRTDSVIFAALDQARDIIRRGAGGARLLRYLLLRMSNSVIRAQYNADRCFRLSNLYVAWASIPFDTMPFCTSLRLHNPRFVDLAESIPIAGRQHELLARRVKNAVEAGGSIYMPVAEVEDLGDVEVLIEKYNSLLYSSAKHQRRKLVHDKRHVFIAGYEDDAVEIITQLQSIAASGEPSYTSAVDSWSSANPTAVDDPLKTEALRVLFETSNVALVYGAAGTGKSTMIYHIAQLFEGEQKLLLAHTNPAVDNLRRRADVPNTQYSTIKKHVDGGMTAALHYRVLVIDECSIVSNASLLEVLRKTSFDLLVLVGDVYQIEAIEFGNWFGLMKSYLSPESVFELKTPYRTSDEELLLLWNRVRVLDDKIEESLSRNHYSAVLGDELFQRESDDEIVLCLNYDGIYGINNINRFLQAGNPNRPVRWGDGVYKVGDPILFNEAEGFRPVIFNNLKGTIRRIETARDQITFDIELARDFDPGDLNVTDLRHVQGKTVQFDVSLRQTSDEDDETSRNLVPFQIGYAVSIHKAQGLEYDTVKIVITDASETRITHSIFYTAITRARRKLSIFWTPGTQQRVLSQMGVRESPTDRSLLKARRGIASVQKVPLRSHRRENP